MQRASSSHKGTKMITGIRRALPLQNRGDPNHQTHHLVQWFHQTSFHSLDTTDLDFGRTQHGTLQVSSLWPRTQGSVHVAWKVSVAPILLQARSTMFKWDAARWKREKRDQSNQDRPSGARGSWQQSRHGQGKNEDKPYTARDPAC